MTLLFPIPEGICKILEAEYSEEKAQYALPLDISGDNHFDDGFFVVTEVHMLFFRHGMLERVLQLKDYTDFATEICSGGGLLRAKEKGSGTPVRLAHFTMEHAPRFAIVARKLDLKSKNKPSSFANDEPDRKCLKCGRVLPEGSTACPYCTDRKEVFLRMAGLLKRYLPMILLGMGILLLITGVGIVMPRLYSHIVNNYYLLPAEKRPEDFLISYGILIGAYALCQVLSSVFTVMRGRLLAGVSTHMMHDLRMMVFDKIQRLSVSYTNKKKIGDLMNRVTHDTLQIQNFVQNEAVECINQVITLIFAGVFLFYINWQMALLVIFPAPVIVITVRMFWRKIHGIYRNLRRLSAKSNSILQDIFSGIRVVKAFGTEKQEISRFEGVSAAFRDRTIKNEYFWCVFQPLITMLTQSTHYLVMLVGGFMILQGDLSIGDITAFTTYASMIYGPIRYMTSLPKTVADTVAASARVFEVLDQRPEVDDSPHPRRLEIKGAVKYDNVTFGYKSYEPVAEEITLDVKPGEMIGLVGHSGAGKSTLTNLLMRFYDVDGGKLSIDGVDIREILQADLHRQIGVVLQETYLFSGTIMENILYSKPDATPEEVIMACKVANAHKFIMNFPDGYETRIGENGHRLSGGERQRIAIARAIIHDPKILILDEATSSLDTENELLIQSALQRLIKGRTTFAIAHRLSTLKNADRLLVLDHGRMAELGTHNELIEKKGIYYNLVMAQLNMTRLVGDVEVSDEAFIDEIKNK